MRDIRDVFKFKEAGRIIFDTESNYDFPKIDYSAEIPLDMIGFNYALSHPGDKLLWVHFYLDDYQFERLWNRPERYVEVLKKFGGIIVPDFSVYANLPKPVLIYQVYRARFLAAYYNSYGINVIANLTWWSENSLEITLESIPKGGVVAITTHGARGKKKEEFLKVFNIVLERLSPKKILVVGKLLDEWKNDDLFREYGNEYKQLELNLNKEGR